MKAFSSLFIFIAIVLTWVTDAEYVEHDKTNLDPNVGCVFPKTREELQFSINVLLSTHDPATSGGALELILCKDTDVTFEDGDPRIKIDIKDNQSFSMVCKVTRKCRITGGYHNGSGRNYLGKGGFLEMSTSSNRGKFINVEGIKFSGFGVTTDGGVFHFFGAGNLHVQFIQCVFHRNHADISGGVALFETTSGEIEIRVKHCIFKENEANRYGGVFAYRMPSGSTHTIIEHSEFIGNRAKSDGGVAAYGATLSNHQLLVKYSKFEDNIADRDGGCFFFIYVNTMEMKDCEFKNNKAGLQGDAYFAIDSTLLIDNVKFNPDSVHSYVSNRWRRI